HFVFLFIVPSKDHHLHLRTLAAIAKMFTNAEIRRRIGEADTREVILTILDPNASRAAT
ncbi:MAG: PTS sugar transporter subunit IIC, partial [Verrucomicrobiales bacterium VVV1]